MIDVVLKTFISIMILLAAFFALIGLWFR